MQQPKISPTRIPTTTTMPKPATTSLFVPYWTIGSEKITDNYDTLIYFGIEPNEYGINAIEPGYKNIGRFFQVVDTSQKKLLTVRVVNNKNAAKLLDDQQYRKRVIAGSIDIAKENGFDGIVLDFEYQALGFESVINNITSFYADFSKMAKNEGLKFVVTMYGDAYFKLRPYDVKAIAQQSDQVLLMAYDFHKAGGEPGPNFPYRGKEKYGYDFSQMIEDFTKDVPKEKLAIIFGYFGYDWEVDEKNKAISMGKALSMREIEQKFVKSCKAKKCEYVQDKDAFETEVTYVDSNDKKHIIWYETQESVKIKNELLKKKGITATSFWAYSYF